MIILSHKGAVTLILNTLWDGWIAGIIDLHIITFMFAHFLKLIIVSLIVLLWFG